MSDRGGVTITPSARDCRTLRDTSSVSDGRLAVARLHHDLVVRGATGFEHAAEHTRGVVRAVTVVEQADEIGAAAAQAARRRIRVIVELADHAHARARACAASRS